MSIADDLLRLTNEAQQEIAAAADLDSLERLRVKYLGKKGSLSLVLRGMGAVPPAERPAIGDAVNKAKTQVEELLATAQTKLAHAALEAELSAPKLDVTLPGRAHFRGRRHPVSRTLDEVVEIFARMGFRVASGPEIELDRYNFELLGMPEGHPARDMQDTFYVDVATLPGAPVGTVLRTHTSPVQIRTMLTQKPPVRIVCPGKVYRCDSDVTHTPMFHQIECLHVERGLTLAHLKGTLDAFVKAFFGDDIRTRLRPSYFPFVEPGCEVDISCVLCRGKGCRVCKQTGFIEVLGAGMVHPEVLRGVGYDPDEVTGYAFGAGLDRMAMLKYGLDDLRVLFENDVRLVSA